MNQISRFVIWMCSKFSRAQLEMIIKELSEVLANRNPEIKPRDDIKEKQPNYRFWAKATGVEPGTIKRDRVGWYTTHMHSAEGNEAYTFGYLYVYRVPLPANVQNVRVPEDARIRIYAATAAQAPVTAAGSIRAANA